MCGKIFVTVVLLIAVVLGVLVNVLTPEQLEIIVPISRFFDAILPILAVGALVKYLFKGNFHCPCRYCNPAEPKMTDKV